jgi:hypothetical protein
MPPTSTAFSACRLAMARVQPLTTLQGLRRMQLRLALEGVDRLMCLQCVAINAKRNGTEPPAISFVLIDYAHISCAICSVSCIFLISLTSSP